MVTVWVIRFLSGILDQSLVLLPPSWRPEALVRPVHSRRRHHPVVPAAGRHRRRGPQPVRRADRRGLREPGAAHPGDRRGLRRRQDLQRDRAHRQGQVVQAGRPGRVPAQGPVQRGFHHVRGTGRGPGPDRAGRGLRLRADHAESDHGIPGRRRPRRDRPPGHDRGRRLQDAADPGRRRAQVAKARPSRPILRRSNPLRNILRLSVVDRSRAGPRAPFDGIFPMPMRTHYCGDVNERLVGSTVEVAGWVHRRRDHGGVIFVDLRDRDGLLQVVFDPDAADGLRRGRAAARRMGHQGDRHGAPAPGGHGQREPRLGPGRTARARHRSAEPLRADPVPARRGGEGRDAAQVPLHRPAPRRDAEAPAPASRDHALDARVPRRQRLHRRRDADADQGDAGRRARLPGAEPHAAGQVLRAAAVAADLQAAADDVGLRPLLPDRALLPRRGPARRPPARVHPARHRDVVPRRATRSWA